MIAAWRSRSCGDLDHNAAIFPGLLRNFLVHDGKRYAPKAVVGLACRYSIGRMLTPDEFSGGEAPGQANFVLRKLGFIVVKEGVEEEQEAQTGKDWTENEVRLAVADYFDMLEAELLGKPYRKVVADVVPA